MNISERTRPLLFYVLQYAAMISIVFFMLFPATYANKALYISAAVWLLFTFINDTDDFCDSFFAPSLATYAVYAWVFFRMFCTMFTRIPYMDTNYFATAFVMLFAFYHIRKNDATANKIIIFTAMIAIALTIVFSVNAMITYSDNIIRKLATPFKDEYDYTGVAGYSWTYGILFFTMALSGMIVNCKKINNNYLIGIIVFYMFVIFSVFIFNTSYLIALVLLTLALVFYLMKIDNGRNLTIMFTIIIFVFLLCLYTGILRQLMVFVGRAIPNQYFKERILGLVALFDSGWMIDGFTEAAAARLINYLDSLKAIGGSPFVGMLNERYLITGLYPGSDSAILGELARFGAIGSAPLFLMIFSSVKTVNKSFVNELQQNIYFVCIVLLMLFSLVNTSFTPTIMFNVFCLVPVFLNTFCRETVNENSLAY